MTRLGFDTGFKSGNEPYRDQWRAGCEWIIDCDFLRDSDSEIREAIERAPRVLKSPEWGMMLKELLSRDLIDVDLVIVPTRDLDKAARSRLSVDLDWMVAEELQGCQREEDQANIHGLALGRAVEACVLFDLSLVLMSFPKLVEDMTYCYQRLASCLDIDSERFEIVWRQLSKPHQVQTA